MNRVISPVNIEERANLELRAGDSVRVWQKIKEKDKVRRQAFEGIILSVKHGKEPGGTFTVRRSEGGFGVEKIFPIYSPMIDKIEIVKRSKVRRAKLYHIREKAAKDVSRQMRNMKIVDISTTSDIDEQNKAEQIAIQTKKEEEAKSKIEAEERAKAEAEAKAIEEAQKVSQEPAPEEKKEE